MNARKLLLMIGIGMLIVVLAAACGAPAPTGGDAEEAATEDTGGRGCARGAGGIRPDCPLPLKTVTTAARSAPSKPWMQAPSSSTCASRTRPSWPRSPSPPSASSRPSRSKRPAAPATCWRSPSAPAPTWSIPGTVAARSSTSASMTTGASRPSPRPLVLRWNQEGAARLLELQSGTVDMITNVSPDDFETVEADPEPAIAAQRQPQHPLPGA